ncbi:MAG: methyltransferase domain-containing protein [Planctomycetota bacterium]|nr:methyltransferase domain-containing protein [Planctomycetota bacterium]
MQSPGDVDYERSGHGYSTHRRADPRIASLIQSALGPARVVLNVGAGAGSYEPQDRYVIAIEPSATMRRQRPAWLPPAIDARAEQLPLDDQSVDASMVTLSVHQWHDRAAGLRELLRVTRGPIVIMTFEGEALDRFWIAHYAPDMIEHERRRYPPIPELARLLSPPGRRATVRTVPIPADCTDGFTEAYFARPERFLEPGVTTAQSVWTFVPPESLERFRARLAGDLASGAWDAQFGDHRRMATFDGALRLVVSELVPAGTIASEPSTSSLDDPGAAHHLS